MSHTLSFQGYLLNKQIIHRNLFLYDVAMFVLLLFLSVSVPYLLLFSAQRYKKIPISADYPVRRSADLQSAVKKCPNLFGLCGFVIRNKQECPYLILGDYKSPGFNRSNLFLRRISNPAGRLAGDGTPSGGDFQPASSSSFILFGWERDRFPGLIGGEPE